MPVRNAPLLPLRIGTAGWSLSSEVREQFAVEGSLLHRYAGRLNAVEINSSFYRRHLPATYARWASETPDAFRFSVKLPKRITHELRLQDSAVLLQEFLAGVSQLGVKFGVLLIQLPPSLEFHARSAELFFRILRDQTKVAAVCEPRHATWFTAEVEVLLRSHDIARVVADPPPVPAAMEFGGSERVRYLRLHGSPKTYYSNYSAEYLDALRERLRQASRTAETWCVFDNTAEGWATHNALALQAG